MSVGGLSNREITFIVKMRDQARAGLRSFGDGLKNMARDAREASTRAKQSLDQIGDSADRNANRLGGLKSAIRGIGLAALVAAAVAAANAFRQAGDTYTEYSNRLTSVGEAAENVRGRLRELNLIARGSASDLDSTVSLYSRASVALGELGAGADETSRFVTTWQRAMAVGGASAQEAASATHQFSQALGSGTLRGEEFNAVNEASPYLMRKLAQAMGVPVGALRQMAQEGRITSEVLREALADMAEGVDDDFSRMQRTSTQAWTALKDQVTLSMGEINASLDANGGLVSIIDSATRAVEGLGEIISGVLEPAMQLFGETAKLALEVTGIQAIIDKVRELSGQAQETGSSFAAHMRAAIQNATTYVRYFREVFRETGRFLGALFVDLGNDLVRPIAASFYTIERISQASMLAMQGKFREAGQLAGTAYAEGIRIAREQFPELEVVFNAPALGPLTNAARAQAEIEAQRARDGRATGSGAPPAAPSGAPGEGARAEATRATTETTEAVAEQNTRISENISLWDAVRVAAGNAMGEIKNRGELMVEGIQTAFDHAGRAFQEFVTSGKLNFQDLVATILREIAAMLASQAWQQFMQGMSGSSTGGSTSSGGSSGNFWADAAMFIAGLFHDGGIVGQARKARSISPAAFANAKRMHKGGLTSGEVPIIAKRGEAVMPTVRMPNGQLGIQATGGGGGTTVIVQAPVYVTVEGGGREGEAIGQEVGEAATKKIREAMRGVAREEIHKAQRLGGMNAWRPA